MSVMSPMDLLIEKLSRLKLETKAWVKERVAVDKKSPQDIEIRIRKIVQNTNMGSWNQTGKDLLLFLEREKYNFLQIAYEKERLASCMTQLQAGDQN